MIYKIIQPSLHLQDFVKDFLLLHYVFDKTDPTPIKPFPASTQHCLVFYLRGGVTAFDPKTGLSKVYPKTSVNGSQISRFDFHLSPHYLMFSVNFQPSALTKFLKLPLTEFIDERIDAEAILNPAIHQLHDRLANANSYESIVEMVEHYLWKRIQSLKTDFHPIEKVAQIISENPNSFNVEKMAGFACLSISQFERKFVQQTGITPKFYARINRFCQAYQIKDKNPKADWLSIALETGYHDYQHLVKDFKQFSDTSPHSLLEAQANSPERILGIA
jgi:AraC-like DNA-binding protein